MKWFVGHVLVGLFLGHVIGDSGKCGTKLLNDYDKVPDSAFSSTSYFIHPDPLKKKADFSAKAARESYDKDNQEYAWCPLNQVETALSEYLEIDLGRLTMVKVVQTKGRFAQGAGKEFTPFYRIRYSRDSKQNWRDYKKFKDKGFRDLLNGPNDAFLDAFETLDPPIVARWVRIFPYSLRSKRVCLKLQLFGCDFENNILEYQMLQGTPAIISNSIMSPQQLKSFADILYPCIDNGYDGNYLEGRLQGGLGLLTDNATGELLTNKTKELFYFVGWHKEYYSQTDNFIDFKFVFANSRNFTSIRIYTYSNPQMQIDYFSRIDLSFSDDDQIYANDITKTDLSSQFHDKEYSLEINLNGHYGRFVKINLYFQLQWLLLSEIVFTSDLRYFVENNGLHKIIDKYNKVSMTNVTQTPSTAANRNIDQLLVTQFAPTHIDKPVSLEIIYVLSILLCLLLGVITAICSFWIIIRRKRSQRKKVMKKQALALCSQNSFVPYNHHSNSLQCLATSLPPVTMKSRGNYPSYTVDRRNYHNGTLGTISNLTGGFHPNSSSLDQSGIGNKICNGDTNIYTSIVGSDNDSSLSPEYATTSVTNDPIFPPSYSETPLSYLPPPIEPIRSDYIRHNNNDMQSLYYPHPNTLPSPQDSVNIWRINNIHNTDNIDHSHNSPNQMSFNDFSYLKYNHSSIQDNYKTNPSSSKYAELPCINYHF